MIAIIVAVVAIGAFLAASNTFIPESSQLPDLFDYSIEPTTSWNDDRNEYSFSQSIKSVNGKDYKDIEIKVTGLRPGEKLYEELLIKTDRSMAEIAEEIGFCNANYFHKIFKQYMDVSPVAYRKTLASEA